LGEDGRTDAYIGVQIQSICLNYSRRCGDYASVRTRQIINRLGENPCRLTDSGVYLFCAHTKTPRSIANKCMYMYVHKMGPEELHVRMYVMCSLMAVEERERACRVCVGDIVIFELVERRRRRRLEAAAKEREAL
jgi:hypothetical protein